MTICRLLVVIVFVLFTKVVAGQKWEIGADAGRAYFQYKFKDHGNGFINKPKISYGLNAGFSVQRHSGQKWYVETGLRFALYQQYYSTRRFDIPWEQVYPVVHIPLLIGVRSESRRLRYTASAGMIVGIMPDQYEAPYGSVVTDIVTGSFDSITRGTMHRNLTPVFPLLNVNASLQYEIAPNWSPEMKVGLGKGFIKISEYDIYYNDGSGSNDRRARQWGKGDFIAITLGVRYRLHSKQD